jgi:fused signal recognition particle receptor
VEVQKILKEGHKLMSAGENPYVILTVGVNGVGKTTTIGKLARHFTDHGFTVTLAAADTFRAAAIEQLEIWADRAGANIVKHRSGADPAAVAFDAVASAKSKNVDIVIIDTAGRLHTKTNLMEELKKIKRVISKEKSSAPHEVLLVVDATSGQNAINQAKIFNDAVGVTGIALTKLDGTAKGGIILAINKELDIPVKLIGVGEAVEDLQDFEPAEFVDALFG